MSKMKYFIILMTVILMSLTICAAADSENLTQTDTHSIGYEIESHIDENNINHKEQALDTDNNIQKKSQENIKTQETTNITTVTQDNYNDYLTISNEKVTLNQNYFVPSNNYIINLTYFPSDTNQFEVNMDNPEYENDNITIVGNGITITNTNIILNKASMNSIILKDIVLNYTPEYDGDYVDVSSVTLNGVTINVDTQRESLSVPLNINGENTLIENCTINANLPSTQIPWEIDPEILEIPQGTGILITEGNVTLRNNVIQVSESSIIDASGYYKSLFGIYIGGDYTTLCNNTVLMTGTQYCYGVVIRSLNNIMSDNNVYVESEYYAAGINIEGNAIKNNLICGNNIDVSAGYNETDMENPDVAYGCLILDKSCGGENYVASSNSMYNNSYINNTVNVDARQVYGFELWGGVNNTIYGNNVTVTGNYPMGIGAIGINTTMDNNTIIAEGTSNSTEFSVDYIRPRTAGIFSYGMKEGNRITNNTVYVNNGRALLMEKAKNLAVENNFLVTEDYSYVIEVNDINNTFKYNAIMGEGTIEEVINDTTDNKNTYINNREPTNSTLTINAPEYVYPNEQNNIIISLKDQEENNLPNQQITVKIGDNAAQTLITNNEGKCTLPVTITETTQITAEYDCYEDCGSSATQEIIVKENNSTNPIITINEYNYNNYLTISSAGKVTLKQTYFVPGNNYTVNFAYLPTEAKQLAINNFYNNKYKNDTLTISGTINNINLQLSKGNLKSLELEDTVLNYDNDYTGDYVNIPSMIGINHVTINVDTQRNSTVNVLTVGANTTVENCTINLNASGNTPTIALNMSGENTTARNCIINANITSNRTSSPLYVGGENSVVENCTINANIPSSQVDWDHNSLPKGIGVWINAFYTTLRNNRFNFTESCILSDGTHR
ncbi:MAG: hypothetical protein VZQ62_02155, partial [Methanosphaera sp.]|nr:hypothetical protein [Methanosphaera sp.]